jgi:hypothetical protein
VVVFLVSTTGERRRDRHSSVIAPISSFWSICRVKPLGHTCTPAAVGLL